MLQAFVNSSYTYVDYHWTIGLLSSGLGFRVWGITYTSPYWIQQPFKQSTRQKLELSNMLTAGAPAEQATTAISTSTSASARANSREQNTSNASAPTSTVRREGERERERDREGERQRGRERAALISSIEAGLWRPSSRCTINSTHEIESHAAIAKRISWQCRL